MRDRPTHYVRYALFGQRRIEGWLEDIGLLLVDRIDGIQTGAGVAGGVAEIGIHHGRLFILMSLMRRPDEAAIAVDLFEDQHMNVDSSGKGDRQQFESNLRRWDPRHDDVIIVQANSWDLDGGVLQRHAGGPLRLVSVDGGHTAELTEHDLDTACDALGPGGVVILDDCFNQFFPSVAEGAQVFFRRRKEFVPFFAGGNKTLICGSEFAERYRRSMLDELAGHPLNAEERTFLGQPIAAAEALNPRWQRRYWRRYIYWRVRAAAGRGPTT
jgi:hypothetical protein